MHSMDLLGTKYWRSISGTDPEFGKKAQLKRKLIHNFIVKLRCLMNTVAVY